MCIPLCTLNGSSYPSSPTTNVTSSVGALSTISNISESRTIIFTEIPALYFCYRADLHLYSAPDLVVPERPYSRVREEKDNVEIAESMQWTVRGQKPR